MSINNTAMNHMKVVLRPILLSFVIVGCSENSAKIPTVPGRWYTEAQTLEGKDLYEANCISCHGVKGRGTVRNWQQTLEDGSYPPPPLNGTAHSWHHPKKALTLTINNGGLALGGKMPGFNDKLNDKQIDSLIAYIQSLWPDDIYRNWESRNK